MPPSQAAVLATTGRLSRYRDQVGYLTGQSLSLRLAARTMARILSSPLTPRFRRVGAGIPAVQLACPGDGPHQRVRWQFRDAQHHKKYLPELCSGQQFIGPAGDMP